MTMSRPTMALLLAVLAGLFTFPFYGGEFYVEMMAEMMILGIFAMSLDLLIGFTGLISFGHAAFFGFAGYMLAIVTPESEPIAIWWALPVCLAAVAVAALVIGWFSVRTSGIYFIMITLAFAQMMYYYFNENQDLGGSDGKFISWDPMVAIGDWQLLDLSDLTTLYYVCFGSLIFVYLLLTVMLNAPFGQVIRGIRANENRTRALGFATFRYKLVSFVIAGTLAGFAGFLEAVRTDFANPAYLGWHESGLVMMFVILGGMGTLYGPALGALILGLLKSEMQDYIERVNLVMGFFVIAVVLFLPHGVAGLVERLGRPKATDDGEAAP
ncbi:MAG: branched-chain amino acid ABC transporter permease [Rhodobacterales bacterium]|nr:branched-chain amino acid ABC transporter permease [Rhodobacterales bacterium]